MKDNKIKIIHYADVQVKNGEKHLATSYRQTLHEIELKISQIEGEKIVVIAGDLFEFANPNEIERELIHTHLSNIANIDSVIEIVIIEGNHDIVKANKAVKSQPNFKNAISLYADTLEKIDYKKREKILLLQETKAFHSKVANIDYYVYSLIDEAFLQNDFTGITPSKEANDETKIVCIFHGMIQEYVISKNLPIPNYKLAELFSVEKFPQNSLILGGDIHEFFECVGLSNQHFLYSGSTTQHTHNEGCYFDVTENGVVANISDDKHILLHDLSNNTYKKIFLRDSVLHETYRIDNSLSIEQVRNNFEKHTVSESGEEINHCNKLIIKIQSSNNLISYEKELKEIIIDYSSKFIEYDAIFVDVEYPKLQQITSSNQTINKILSEKTESSEIDNIDNLVLSNENLNTLFSETLIAKLKKEKIVDADFKQEILDIFNQQLSICNDTTSARFDIELLRLKNNTQFMSLTKNDIRLDVPGLTRILATNKVGKTTMMRMLKWTIDGELYENMSKTKSIANNLFVFNKFNPLHDFVETELFFNINKKPIRVVRSVNRIWKNNITNEQKLSENWKTFVQTVERSIKLEILSTDGTVKKSIEGTTAEETLKLWFGKTVENILFIDETKIRNILRMDSTKLNELILDLIGVDYLKTLESNIDIVKDSLFENLQKPKTDISDIEKYLLVNNEEKNKITSLIDATKKEIDETTISSDELNKELQQKNNELINIGNVAATINDLKVKMFDTKNIIDSTEIPTKKELIVLSETKPFKTDTTIQQNAIDELKAKVSDFDTQLTSIQNDKKTLFETLKLQLANDLAHNKNVLESKTSDVSTLKIFIDTNLETLSTNVSAILLQLNEKRDKNIETITTIINEISTAENKIVELKALIDNSICPTCKKPFADDFEEHKKQYIEVEIPQLQQTILEKNELLTKKKAFKEKAETVIAEWKVLNTKLLQKNIDELYEINFTYSEDALLLFKNIKKSKEILVNVESEIVDLNKKIAAIETCIKYVEMDSTQFFVPFLSDLYANEATKLNELKSSFEKLNVDKTEISNEIIAIQNIINDEEKAYNEALQTYQNAIENNIKLNNEITKFNDSIQEKINEYNQLKVDYVKFNEDVVKLQQEKLPLFNKLSDEKNATILAIQQNDSFLESKNSELLNYNNQLQKTLSNIDDFKQQSINYYKYQRANLLLKIYSSLIKSDFKDIVFEYYRNFLNSTLNDLLSDVNFKLYWNENSELIHISNEYAKITFQNVQQSSGMETCFLGLSLIYTIHLLNIKNKISHLFIDEISGTLNDGKDLSYDAKNYKQLFADILSKFSNKYVFIVDHSVDNLFETATYEVIPSENGSLYKLK